MNCSSNLWQASTDSSEPFERKNQQGRVFAEPLDEFPVQAEVVADESISSEVDGSDATGQRQSVLGSIVATLRPILIASAILAAVPVVPLGSITLTSNLANGLPTKQVLLNVLFWFGAGLVLTIVFFALGTWAAILRYFRQWADVRPNSFLALPFSLKRGARLIDRRTQYA